MPDEFAALLTDYIRISMPMPVSVFVNNKSGKFDISLIAIWLVAVLTIFLGALWTKHEFHVSLAKIEYEAVNKVESNQNLVTNTEPGDEQPAPKEKTEHKNSDDEQNITTISVGYMSIFVLLVFVVSILLLLYFFYNVMSEPSNSFLFG